jgi:hypothetical protein
VNINPTSSGMTGSRERSYGDDSGFDFYHPSPVEIQISIPKKQPVLALKKAKEYEQLKAWGLRR